MEALARLAAAGHTVVAAIHQPRSRIFDLFDDLLLLSAGTPMYVGPAAGAVPHFASLGHPCPAHHNPAEFLADLISPDNATDASAQESRERLARLAARAPGARPAAAAVWPPHMRLDRHAFSSSVGVATRVCVHVCARACVRAPACGCASMCARVSPGVCACLCRHTGRMSWGEWWLGGVAGSRGGAARGSGWQGGMAVAQLGFVST